MIFVRVIKVNKRIVFSCVDLVRGFSSEKMAKWELYLKQWLEKQFVQHDDESIDRENKWCMYELVRTLVTKGIIPADIKDDCTLYDLLVAQANKTFCELLRLPKYGLVMPQHRYAPQSNREVLIEYGTKVEAAKQRLEAETGVNITYYNKIKSVYDKRQKAPFNIVTKSGRVTKRKST
jgi:hypothetical protein